jgi:flagellar hook protein FlgE
VSLFSTLNTATSGLVVSSSNLGVIGDNIANMNTVGFKGSRSEFADFMPQDVFGIAGPSQIGKGAGMNNLQTIFGQGALETSENPIDLAISGDGFFQVNDGVSDYYSRAGQFYIDKDGFVVNAQGLNLQGYNATNGTLGATLDNLQLDLASIQPAVTTEINVSATLDADADVTGGVAALGALDGTNVTLETAADGADFASSVTVYDSLGVAHEVTMLYEYAGSNQWNWYAVVDGNAVTDTTSGLPSAAIEDGAFQIASGTATFDTDGLLTTFTETQTSASNAWNFTGAAAQDIALDFGVDTAGDPSDGNVRMLAGESAHSGITQDGYPPGDLISLAVGSDGGVTGRYSNGEDIILGSVVVAKFAANTGLEKVGGTLYRETVTSGSPVLGDPGTGGRGSVIGNALELSNVDLEGEFISMITSQRTYQANARMVETANSTLQELVQLV